MRKILVAFPAMLALAACQQEPFESADGSFDRAAYRNVMTETCRIGVAQSGRVPSPDEQNRICDCVSDRILAQDDDTLRIQVRDREQDDAANLDAFTHCAGLATAAEIPAVASEAPPELPPVPATNSDVGAGSPPGTARARARANLASYISQDDYPAAALRNGEHGRVAVAIEIGPDGRVSGCRVTQSSGSASLDSTTCSIIRSRARYTPARDAQGAVVADRDQAAITWTLPTD